MSASHLNLSLTPCTTSLIWDWNASMVDPSAPWSVSLITGPIFDKTSCERESTDLPDPRKLFCALSCNRHSPQVLSNTLIRNNKFAISWVVLCMTSRS